MGVKRERVLVTVEAVYTCERCSHRWTPRKPLETTDAPLPKVCAGCRSKYWNTKPGTVKPGPKKPSAATTTGASPAATAARES